MSRRISPFTCILVEVRGGLLCFPLALGHCWCSSKLTAAPGHRLTRGHPPSPCWSCVSSVGTVAHCTRSLAGQFLTACLGGGEALICRFLVSVMQTLAMAKFTLPVSIMCTDFFSPKATKILRSLKISQYR